jgi:hypothetical protein
VNVASPGAFPPDAVAEEVPVKTAPYPAPEGVSEIGASTFPVLVRVNGSVPVVPATTLPNAVLAIVSPRIAPWALSSRAMTMGDAPGALVLIVSVLSNAPAATLAVAGIGLGVTWIVAVPLAGTEPVGASRL